MATMRDVLDSEEARANREANPPAEGLTEAPVPGAGSTKAQAQEEAHLEAESDRARLGPLGAFFKRRADYFEQEATMLAIQLERMWQDAISPRSDPWLSYPTTRPARCS